MWDAVGVVPRQQKWEMTLLVSGPTEMSLPAPSSSSLKLVTAFLDLGTRRMSSLVLASTPQWAKLSLPLLGPQEMSLSVWASPMAWKHQRICSPPARDLEMQVVLGDESCHPETLYATVFRRGHTARSPQLRPDRRACLPPKGQFSSALSGKVYRLQHPPLHRHRQRCAQLRRSGCEFLDEEGR